jgi:DNA repair protein RadC
MNKDDEIVKQALEVLHKRVAKRTKFITSSNDVVNLLKLSLGTLEHEVFGVVALDTQLRYIDHEVLFRGSLLYTAVLPREVVKYALAKNAATLVLYHNHPTGSKMPSPGDKELTEILCNILRVVDVYVHDHIIVAGESITSFNELGIMPNGG